jgi:hypothetical protein
MAICGRFRPPPDFDESAGRIAGYRILWTVCAFLAKRSYLPDFSQLRTKPLRALLELLHCRLSAAHLLLNEWTGRGADAAPRPV